MGGQGKIERELGGGKCRVGSEYGDKRERWREHGAEKAQIGSDCRGGK